jgi:AcrR family transcriptional regulator
MKRVCHYDDATPERRAKLLDEIVEYILDHGLAGLSLRPLAAGVTTSPRMLLYFFGSKEELISEVLAQIRLRQQADFARAVSGTGRRKERFMRAWNAWSSRRWVNSGGSALRFMVLRSRTPNSSQNF